jgi:hypothetical protein
MHRIQDFLVFDRRDEGLCTLRDIRRRDSLPAGFSTHAPEISIEHIPACPVCQSAIRAHFATGYDYKLETCRNTWHFWQCDFSLPCSTRGWYVLAPGSLDLPRGYG